MSVTLKLLKQCWITRPSTEQEGKKMVWVALAVSFFWMLVLAIAVLSLCWRKIQRLEFAAEQLFSTSSRFVIKMALYDVFQENDGWIVDEEKMKDYAEVMKIMMLYKRMREVFLGFTKLGYEDASGGKPVEDIEISEKDFEELPIGFIKICAFRAYMYGYNQSELVGMVLGPGDEEPEVPGGLPEGTN